MPKIKKKAKSLMQPEDEIKSMAHHASEYYQVYQKQFTMAIVAIVLVLAVALIYSFVSSSNEKKAGQMLSAAYDASNPGGGAPANYPQALQRYQDIVKQYGGTLNGAIAQFYLGNTYVQMGQPEAALKEYETFINKYSGERLLLGLVYQRMGYAYLALGKQDQAVKAFGQAESIAGTGPATLELARLYEREGKIQEAQKRYKVISEKLPSSAWAMEARKKLQPPDLGQAPKPAQPAAAPK
ncbi:MAG: tetratricopeptide repeat protein [Nitrospirota bacterium]